MTDIVRKRFETDKAIWEKRHRVDSAGRDYTFHAKIPKSGDSGGLLRNQKQQSYAAAKTHAITEEIEIANRVFLYNQVDKTGTFERKNYTDAVDLKYESHLPLSAMLEDYHMDMHDIDLHTLREIIIETFEQDLHLRRTIDYEEGYNRISWYIQYDVIADGYTTEIYQATTLLDVRDISVGRWSREMIQLLEGMNQRYDDYTNVILKEFGINFRRMPTQ